MTDDRHAPDTFFLVAEADFRLYREHCVADRDWMTEVDAFARGFLLGAKDKIDSRPTTAPAAPVQPKYEEPDEDTQAESGLLDWLAAPQPEGASAAASSAIVPAPPRPERPAAQTPRRNQKKQACRPAFTAGPRPQGTRALRPI